VSSGCGRFGRRLGFDPGRIVRGGPGRGKVSP